MFFSGQLYIQMRAAILDGTGLLVLWEPLPGDSQHSLSFLHQRRAWPCWCWVWFQNLKDWYLWTSSWSQLHKCNMCFSNVNSNIKKNLALFQLQRDLTPSISYPRDKKTVTWRQPPLTWLNTSPLWLWTLSCINKDQSTFVFLKSSHHLKLTWNTTKLVCKIIPLEIHTFIAFYCQLFRTLEFY